MAKHIYHIPIQNTLAFIKEYKSTLKNLLIKKNKLEYDKLLGKSYYHLQIEDFIQFFKIEKDIDYALDTIAYFNGSLFIDEIFAQLNFTQFALEENTVNKKDFFYAFCSLYTKSDNERFSLFIQTMFLHFHSTFNTQTNAYIDYQAMSQTLAKSKNIVIKESFGEEGKNAFYKLLLNDILYVQIKGKRIKTLRKNAYKKILPILVSWEEERNNDKDEAYNVMDRIKNSL